MARGDRPRPFVRRVSDVGVGTVRAHRPSARRGAHRPALLLALLVLAALVCLLALPPAPAAAAPAAQWVLTQTLVNPGKEKLEYHGGGSDPEFFGEERFKDMVMIYKPSATSFSIKDRWQDREYIAWDVTITCNFSAPQATLVPGKSYKLTASFSHSGTLKDIHPGEAFTYYSPDFSFDPGDSLLYYPSDPKTASSMTWGFAAPSASPGATMEIQAGLWNAPACTVIWRYEARAVAPEYGVIESDGVIRLVSPPGGVLRISRADLPEWARDAVATVGDEVACVGPPATLTEGDSTVLLDGKPVARAGDGTSHGGTVVSGDSRILVNGVPAATVGNYATCPMVMPGGIPHVGGPIIGRPGTASSGTSAAGQGETGQQQPPTFTEQEFENAKADVAAQSTSALGPAIEALTKQGYIGMVIAATGDCALYDHTGERMRDPAGRSIYSETGSYQLVRIGDTLQTGSRGFMRIELFDWDGDPKHRPTVVNMANDTRMVFSRFGQNRSPSTLVTLLEGAIRAITRPWTDSSLTIKAAVRLCYVKGSDVLVSYDPASDELAPSGQNGPVEYLGACVLEGHMDVTDSNTGKTVSLTDKQMVAVIDETMDPVESFSLEDWSGWEELYGVEDTQPLSTEEWEALIYGGAPTTAPPTTAGATTTTAPSAGQAGTGGQQPPTFTQAEFLAMKAEVAAQAPRALTDYIRGRMEWGYIGLVTAWSGEYEIIDWSGAVQPYLSLAVRDTTWLQVRIGDTIRTGADGNVRIELFDWDGSSPGGASLISMGPNTTVVFTGFDCDSKESTGVSLLRGGIRVVFQGPGADSSLNVRAGTALCGVRGSDVMVFYTPATDRVDAYVGEGRLDVGSSKTGQATFLTEGQRMVVDRGSLGQMEPLSREGWQTIVEGSGFTDMTPLTLEQLKNLGKSGLTTAAWIGVGFAAAAFLAAAGVGIYLLRRRPRRAAGGTAAPAETPPAVDVPAPADSQAPVDTPAPTPRFCRDCGSPIRPGTLFCEKCGGRH